MNDFDAWIARQSPDDVIAALAPLLTDERRAKIDAVLDARISGLTVVLENLYDPHNGAAAMRSVEGFGLGELHFVPGEAKGSQGQEGGGSSGFARRGDRRSLNRFSARVAQGAEKWVDLTRHTSFADCARGLHERGFALAAAVPGGQVALAEIDVTRPVALCFGNEHAGLTPEAQAACDLTFGIPMQGFTQSFNLSVSVAISVYECARRRRAAGDFGLSDAEKLRLRARWHALSLDARAVVGIVERHVSERTRGSVGG